LSINGDFYFEQTIENAMKCQPGCVHFPLDTLNDKGILNEKDIMDITKTGISA